MADISIQQTLMVNGNVSLPTEITEVHDNSVCLEEQNVKDVSAADILQQALEEAEGFSHVTGAYSGEDSSIVEDYPQLRNDHSYIHTVNGENISGSVAIREEENSQVTGDVEHAIAGGNFVQTTDNESLHMQVSGDLTRVSNCVEEVGTDSFAETDASQRSINNNDSVSFPVTEICESEGTIETTEAENVSLIHCQSATVSSTNNSLLLTPEFQESRTETRAEHPDQNAQEREDSLRIMPTNSTGLTRLTLPPKSTNAPLGSSENPIQIIQQGNTYHSTQVLSQEQLQQIAHVLQQQQVTKAMQNGGRAVLYDQATNTRIIYRVIYPSELQAKCNSDASSGRSAIGRGSGIGRGRGRPRKGWNKRIDDDEKGNPNLSKEEREERKRHRPRTRSGRISKPPSYMVKDYKRIHHLDFNEEPYDDSDGGYSDFQLSDEEHEKRQGKGGCLPPGVTTAKQRNYKCSSCTKAYIGRGGLSRHYRLNPTHGSLPEREDASTQDENSNSSLASSVVSSSGYPVQGSTSFGPPGARVEAEASPQQTVSFHDTGSSRRKSRLKELLRQYRDEELMEIVLPKLANVVTLWEFLLMKTEKGNPSQPHVPDIFKHFGTLLKRMQMIAKSCLSPVTSADSHNKTTVDITNEDLAKALSINTGIYEIKNFHANRGSTFEYKRLTLNPEDAYRNQNSRALVEVVSPEEIISPPSKRQRTNSGETCAVDDALSANLPDQLLSDVVQEVDSLDLPSLHSDGLDSDLQRQDSSQLLSETLCSSDTQGDLSSRVLFDLSSSTVSSERLSSVDGNSTTVTSSSLSSGSLSTVDSSEALRTHGIMATAAQQLQNIQVRKVQLFGSSQHLGGADTDITLHTYANTNDSNCIVGTEHLNPVQEQTEVQKRTTICDKDKTNIVDKCNLDSITTSINTIGAYDNGHTLSAGTLILDVTPTTATSNVSIPSTNLSLLKVNKNIQNNSLDHCEAGSVQEDVVTCDVLHSLTGATNIVDKLHGQSDIEKNTADVCVPDLADASAAHLDSKAKYAEFNAIACSDETVQTGQPLEGTAVIRQLLLPDGQVIGIWSTVEDQTEKELGEQFAQGYLPGNLIIVQNPDGTLQVPNDQAVPLETLQALVAVDHTFVSQAEVNSEEQTNV